MRSSFRFGTALTALAFVYAATTGCGIVDPCQTIIIDAADRLSGQWTLATILGGPIPAGGFPIPQGNPLTDPNFRIDYLKAGTLRFVATDQSGSCSDNKAGIERGRVIASYLLVNKNGAPVPSLVYGGSYKYDRTSSVVTLSAAGKEATGSRFLATLTLDVTISGLSGRLGFQQQ